MTPRAEQQGFGRSVGGVLVLIAAYSAWRGRAEVAAATGAIGLMLLVLSWAAPAVLSKPAKAWWAFAHVLGWINIRILLTIFFVLVFVPVGLVFRIIGRDLLDRRRKGSSWLPYAVGRDPRHYERMY